jgi:hypothetical protein
MPCPHQHQTYAGQLELVLQNWHRIGEVCQSETKIRKSDERTVGPFLAVWERCKRRIDYSFECTDDIKKALWELVFAALEEAILL